MTGSSRDRARTLELLIRAAVAEERLLGARLARMAESQRAHARGGRAVSCGASTSGSPRRRTARLRLAWVTPANCGWVGRRRDGPSRRPLASFALYGPKLARPLARRPNPPPSMPQLTFAGVRPARSDTAARPPAASSVRAATRHANVVASTARSIVPRSSRVEAALAPPGEEAAAERVAGADRVDDLGARGRRPPPRRCGSRPARRSARASAARASGRARAGRGRPRPAAGRRRARRGPPR